MQLPRIIFTIAVGTTLVLGYFIRGPKIFNFPYNLLGIFIIGLGFYFMLWARNTFNAKKTTIHPAGMPSFLVTEGPYKFSRNPMYLGNLLILVGSAIILGNLTFFLASALFLLGINQIVIPYEEKKLKDIFGSSFESYGQKVGRWF